MKPSVASKLSDKKEITLQTNSVTYFNLNFQKVFEFMFCYCLVYHVFCVFMPNKVVVN